MTQELKEVPLETVLGYYSGDFPECDAEPGCYEECTCWGSWGLWEKRRDSGYEELLDSIREVGILVPVSVDRRRDGTFEVSNGHHRLAAAQELGFPTVLVEYYY